MLISDSQISIHCTITIHNEYKSSLMVVCIVLNIILARGHVTHMALCESQKEFRGQPDPLFPFNPPKSRVLGGYNEHCNEIQIDKYKPDTHLINHPAHTYHISIWSTYMVNDEWARVSAYPVRTGSASERGLERKEWRWLHYMKAYTCLPTINIVHMNSVDI